MDEQVCGCGVFETAFSTFGEWGPKGTGDDYVFGRLGEYALPPAGDIGF